MPNRECTNQPEKLNSGRVTGYAEVSLAHNMSGVFWRMKCPLNGRRGWSHAREHGDLSEYRSGAGDELKEVLLRATYVLEKSR